MFDPTPYTRPPVLDVQTAIAVGTALANAAPTDLASEGKKLLGRVKKKTAALAARFALPGMHKDARASDTVIDRAWGALYDRLDAYARLPVAVYPKAARALELREAIFPNESLVFLTLIFLAEWAESDKRLKQIDHDGLQNDLDGLCGKEFLENVRVAHAAYGEVLGVTKPGQAVDTKLAEEFAAVKKAIGKYSFHLASLADDDEPETVARVQAALLPLDEHRAAQARRNAAGGQPAPVPPPVVPPKAPSAPETATGEAPADPGKPSK